MVACELFNLYRNKRRHNKFSEVHENALSDDMSINEAYGTEPHAYACVGNSEQNISIYQAYGDSGAFKRNAEQEDKSFNLVKLESKDDSDHDDKPFHQDHETEPRKGICIDNSWQDNSFNNQIYEAMEPGDVQPRDVIPTGKAKADFQIKSDHIYDFPKHDTIS